MLKDLNIDQTARLKTLSKGNQEKVALILVMSRDAKLYILDERSEVLTLLPEITSYTRF